MGYADQMAPAVASLPVSLVLVSVLAGLAMMLLFKAASRPTAIRAAHKKVQARLLELRLFGDEPWLVWRAQAGLLKANLLYLRAMLIPIVAVAIPFTLAFPHLEAIYGRAPLPAGAATVLTMRLHGGFGPQLPRARLVAPPGLRVETEGVRAAATKEISWEIRAEGPVAAPVQIELGDSSIHKVVRTGAAGGYLAETATASPLAWLMAPGEPLIAAKSVDWVSVSYRGKRYSAAGLTLPWEGWFLIFSFAAALVGKSYWKVAF